MVTSFVQVGAGAGAHGIGAGAGAHGIGAGAGANGIGAGAAGAAAPQSPAGTWMVWTWYCWSHSPQLELLLLLLEENILDGVLW